MKFIIVLVFFGSSGVDLLPGNEFDTQAACEVAKGSALRSIDEYFAKGLIVKAPDGSPAKRDQFDVKCYEASDDQ